MTSWNCVLFILFISSFVYSSLHDPCPRWSVQNEKKCKVKKCYINCYELLESMNPTQTITRQMREFYQELYVPAELCDKECPYYNEKNVCSCVKFLKYYDYTNTQLEVFKQTLQQSCWVLHEKKFRK